MWFNICLIKWKKYSLKLLKIIKVTFKKVNLSNISVKNHDIVRKIIHVDAYRIDKDFNINSLQLEKYLDDKECLIFVEWKQKLLNYKTDIILVLEKNINNDRIRTIKISKN